MRERVFSDQQALRREADERFNKETMRLKAKVVALELFSAVVFVGLMVGLAMVAI